MALAQLILQQPELVRGKKVCDIGSGLGLAGIAAALSGIFALPTFGVAVSCGTKPAWRSACRVTL